VYLGAKRRYINTLPFLFLPSFVVISRDGRKLVTRVCVLP